MVETKCEVVPFRSDQATAWKALNEGWILEAGFSLEPKDLKVLTDPVGQIIDQGGHIFLAEGDDGQAVGCCALMAMDDGGYELCKMAVTPSARGQGVSKLLIQACIDKARQLGAVRLYLETNSVLTPALKLYEAFGFIYLPQRDTPYVRADVFMELVL